MYIFDIEGICYIVFIYRIKGEKRVKKNPFPIGTGFGGEIGI